MDERTTTTYRNFLLVSFGQLKLVFKSVYRKKNSFLYLMLQQQRSIHHNNQIPNSQQLQSQMDPQIQSHVQQSRMINSSNMQMHMQSQQPQLNQSQPVHQQNFQIHQQQVINDIIRHSYSV